MMAGCSPNAKDCHWEPRGGCGPRYVALARTRIEAVVEASGAIWDGLAGIANEVVLGPSPVRGWRPSPRSLSQ